MEELRELLKQCEFGEKSQKRDNIRAWIKIYNQKMEHLLNLHDLEQSYKAYKNELTEIVDR